MKTLKIELTAKSGNKGILEIILKDFSLTGSFNIFSVKLQKNVTLGYREMVATFGQDFQKQIEIAIRKALAGTEIRIETSMNSWGKVIHGYINDCFIHENIVSLFFYCPFAGTFTLTENKIEQAKKENYKKVQRLENDGDWSEIFH